MSDTDIVYNYSEHNDSYDWTDVIAGTVTLKLTTVLDKGDAFHFENHPMGFGTIVELVGDGVNTLDDLIPTGGGSIIFDGELSGQRVIKWDTGRMVIVNRTTLSLDVNVASGALYRNDATLPAAKTTFAESFVSIRCLVAQNDQNTNSVVSARAAVTTVNDFTAYVFRVVSSVGITINIAWIAEGRWK